MTMTDVDEMIREIDWEVAATRRYIGKDALSAKVIAASCQPNRRMKVLA